MTQNARKGAADTPGLGAHEGMARGPQESRVSLLQSGCDIGHASSVAM